MSASRRSAVAQRLDPSVPWRGARCHLHLRTCFRLVQQPAHPPLHLLHSRLELLARQGAVTHSVLPVEEAVWLLVAGHLARGRAPRSGRVGVPGFHPFASVNVKIVTGAASPPRAR